MEDLIAVPDLGDIIPAPLYWITTDVSTETLQQNKIVYEEHEISFFHEVCCGIFFVTIFDLPRNVHHYSLLFVARFFSVTTQFSSTFT